MKALILAGGEGTRLRPAARPKNSALDDHVLRLSGLPRLPDFRPSPARLAGALV